MRMDATAKDPIGTADAEAGERERERPGTAAGLVFHGEREQHLDRPHDDEHEHGREHECREEPARAQQVGEPVAQVDERLTHGMHRGAVEVAAYRGRAHHGQHRCRGDLQGRH